MATVEQQLLTSLFHFPRYSDLHHQHWDECDSEDDQGGDDGEDFSGIGGEHSNNNCHNNNGDNGDNGDNNNKINIDEEIAIASSRFSWDSGNDDDNHHDDNDNYYDNYDYQCYSDDDIRDAAFVEFADLLDDTEEFLWHNQCAQDASIGARKSGLVGRENRRKKRMSERGQRVAQACYEAWLSKIQALRARKSDRRSKRRSQGLASPPKSKSTSPVNDICLGPASAISDYQAASYQAASYQPPAVRRAVTAAEREEQQLRQALEASRREAQAAQARALNTAGHGGSGNVGLTVQEALALLSRDLGPDDYELLLRLDETVKPRNVVSQDTFRTKIRLRTATGAADEGSCAICLVDRFDAGDQISAIPTCNHVFHGNCLEKWLCNSAARCPLCNTEFS